jgi:hypothetical protein
MNTSHPHVAVVTVWQSEGAMEFERRVHTIEELFDVCKAAPPSKLVRVTLQGPEGEVTLNFANFLRKP